MSFRGGVEEWGFVWGKRGLVVGGVCAVWVRESAELVVEEGVEVRRARQSFFCRAHLLRVRAKKKALLGSAHPDALLNDQRAATRHTQHTQHHTRALHPSHPPHDTHTHTQHTHTHTHPTHTVAHPTQPQRACIAKLNVMNSHTGRRPANAAPTAMPVKPASVMGVSLTRSAPYF